MRVESPSVYHIPATRSAKRRFALPPCRVGLPDLRTLGATQVSQRSALQQHADRPYARTPPQSDSVGHGTPSIQPLAQGLLWRTSRIFSKAPQISPPKGMRFRQAHRPAQRYFRAASRNHIPARDANIVQSALAASASPRFARRCSG